MLRVRTAATRSRLTCRIWARAVVVLVLVVVVVLLLLLLLVLLVPLEALVAAPPLLLVVPPAAGAVLLLVVVVDVAFLAWRSFMSCFALASAALGGTSLFWLYTTLILRFV